MNSIMKRRAVIIEKIKNLNKELVDIQEECDHLNATHINRSDAGNWCKSDDRYWTAHDCPDCGKYWETDQDWSKKK